MTATFKAQIIIAKYSDNRMLPFGLPLFYTGYKKKTPDNDFEYVPEFKTVSVTALNGKGKSGTFNPVIFYGDRESDSFNEFISTVNKKFNAAFFNESWACQEYKLKEGESLIVEPMLLEDYLELLKNMI